MNQHLPRLLRWSCPFTRFIMFWRCIKSAHSTTEFHTTPAWVRFDRTRLECKRKGIPADSTSFVETNSCNDADRDFMMSNGHME